MCSNFSFNKLWLATSLCSKHMNPVHILTPSLFKIKFSNILPYMCKNPKLTLLLRFSHNFVCISRRYATCPAYLNLLDLIILVIFCGYYKLWTLSPWRINIIVCWYVVFSINIIKLQITTHVTEQHILSERMISGEKYGRMLLWAYFIA